ncbi:MAG: hypothetical protein U0414_29515 [Polyangiaceae bacterium]
MTTEQRRDLAVLMAVGLAAFAVRIALIVTYPDIDGDAYGHFNAGRAFARDPWNLGVHWVWLPLYHAFIGLVTGLGLGFTALRVLSSVVALAAPWVLYRWVLPASPSRARLAAALFTIAPLSNALAVSAQAETLFTLVIVALALALERARFGVAAALLTIASGMRYEAWGAVAAWALYVGHRRFARGVPMGRSLVVVAPLVFIVGWIVAHRVHDGAWLTFLTETRSFAGGLRSTTERSWLVDAIRLPLLTPFIVFGPALLLAVAGVPGAAAAGRAGWVPAAGVFAFLLASYVGRGALAGERYFTALTPFVCVLVASGVEAIERRLPSPTRARWIARFAVTAILRDDGRAPREERPHGPGARVRAARGRGTRQSVTPEEPTFRDLGAWR